MNRFRNRYFITTVGLLLSTTALCYTLIKADLLLLAIWTFANFVTSELNKA